MDANDFEILLIDITFCNYHVLKLLFNSSTAELFVSIIHSFEAGAADATPVSNEWKILFMQNRYLQIWIIWLGLTQHLPQDILPGIHFSGILFSLNFLKAV